jgi:two-component system, OmpR family, sensor histidine kinase KdpD
MNGIWANSRGYLAGLLLVAAFTGLIALVRLPGEVSNASMLYLVAVLAVAVFYGSGPAMFAALAAFVSYNFFFVEPQYTFRVDDSDEWLTLGLLLISGLVTGRLAAAMRERALQAEHREQEAVLLYDTVRALTNTDVSESLKGITERLKSGLDLNAVMLTIRDGSQDGQVISTGDPEALALARAVPEMVLTSATSAEPSRGGPGRWIRVVSPVAQPRPARRSDRVRSIPVIVEGSQVGALIVVRRRDGRRFADADGRLLSALASQISSTLERIRLQREAVDAEVLRRTDELRKALLDAVSHDLRTPLSSIIASAGSLLQQDVAWTEDERRAFAASIVEEGQRLNRLVGNLLDLSRIEAGTLHPDKAWHDLAALVQEAAGRAERLHPQRIFIVDQASEVPPVLFDYVEIDQVVANLLENAVRHGRGEVSVVVQAGADAVRVEVSDNGPGILERDFPRLFRPFYRGGATVPGSGLGLAVARGFVLAHGGRMWGENRTEGGARFIFTLPLSGSPAVAA